MRMYAWLIRRWMKFLGGKDIPKDIFLNDVLPYASLNERRDNWRRDFHQRFIKIAIEKKTIDQAVLALNKYVFDTLHVLIARISVQA